MFLPEWQEGYHSKHGAIREARHVFIENGFSRLAHREALRILEIGLGTGLNALLSFLEAREATVKVEYIGMEKHPLTPAEVSCLNYASQLEAACAAEVLQKIHESAWRAPVALSPHFSLSKIRADFRAFDQLGLPEVDLVYYDAFSARVQAALWEDQTIAPIAESVKRGGVFVTYSSKASLRRLLGRLGFTVEKRPGPAGKREMVSALKR